MRDACVSCFVLDVLAVLGSRLYDSCCMCLCCASVCYYLRVVVRDASVMVCVRCFVDCMPCVGCVWIAFVPVVVMCGCSYC